jgi:DNA-directed RNA polymerase alpha subunit
MFNEGTWYEGPPEDVFDFLIAQREDAIIDGDEWDEEWEASIDSMLLPPNVINALHNAGFHEIEELKKLSDADLLKIKGIGKKSLEDIREALEYED